MGKIVSLKRNADFRRLYRRGTCAVRGTLVVYAAKNRRGINRLGITAGKKVGCAAKRNLAKRRIRALYRRYIPVLLRDGAADMVVVARASAARAEFSRMESDFVSAVNAVLPRTV